MSGKVTPKIRKTRVRYNLRQKSYGKPRLSVYRGNCNIHVQLIDDLTRTTLVAASSLEKELKSKLKNGGDIKAAKEVGELIGKRALEKGITEVIFDRGQYKYHGRVKALADSAREAGLKF